MAWRLLSGILLLESKSKGVNETAAAKEIIFLNILEKYDYVKIINIDFSWVTIADFVTSLELKKNINS